jgi:hypothetical protein
MTTTNKIKHVVVAALLFVAGVYCGVVGNWSFCIGLLLASGFLVSAVIKP